MKQRFFSWVARKATETEENPFTAQPDVQRTIVAHPQTLITSEQLGSILDRPGNYPDTLCIMRDMQFVPQETFGSRQQLEAFVRSTGATISFAATQRSLGAVKLFCEAVEELCEIRTFGTVYQTPAGMQGFRVHWDLGSVVVLQLEGKKKWTVQAPIVSSVDEIKGRNPHLTDAEAAQASTVIKTTLEPGDALFIPRGAPHYAEAEDGAPSLHLSLGLLHADIDLNNVTVYP